MKRLKNNLITGLLTILPLFITFYILTFIFTKIITFLKQYPYLSNLIEYLIDNKDYSLWMSTLLVYTLALLALAMLLITVGAFTKFTIGHKLTGLVDTIFTKIPLVSSIYTTLIQIRKILLSNNTRAYQKVVMIEYPRRGIYSLGFLTNIGNDYFKKRIGAKKIYNIFVPTSPNPTSGLFLMLPEEDVEILDDMKVEEAIKLIISGGAVIPEDVAKLKKGGDNEKTTSNDDNS